MAQQEAENNQKPLRGALVFSQEEGYKLMSIVLNVGPGEYSRILVEDGTYLVGVEGAREHGQDLYTFPVLDGTKVHIMLISSLDEQHSARYLVQENGILEQGSPQFGLEIVEEIGFFYAEPEDLDAELQRAQSEAPALEDVSFWQADGADLRPFRGSLIYRQQRGYTEIAIALTVFPGEESQVMVEANGFISTAHADSQGSLYLYRFPAVDGTHLRVILSSSTDVPQEARYQVHAGEVHDVSLTQDFRLAIVNDALPRESERKPLPLKEYPTWKEAFTDALSYYGERALLWFRDGLDGLRDGLDAMIEKLDRDRRDFFGDTFGR